MKSSYHKVVKTDNGNFLETPELPDFPVIFMNYRNIRKFCEYSKLLTNPGTQYNSSRSPVSRLFFLTSSKFWPATVFTLSASILGVKNRKALAPVINVRQAVLISFTAQCFCEVLVNGLHPLREKSDHTLGMFGHWFVLLISLSITLFAYVGVLFHW